MPLAESSADYREPGFEKMSIGARIARLLADIDVIEVFAKAGYICFDCVEPVHEEDPNGSQSRTTANSVTLT